MMRGLLFSLLCQQAIGRKYAYLKDHIIADYECYDKTNEDEDRNVLKDLSGNGHDIQLYNFGFAEGSGYGKYITNFRGNCGINNYKYGTLSATKNKITFIASKAFSVNVSPFWCRVKDTHSWKLKTGNTGIVLKVDGEIYADVEPNSIGEVKALSQDQIDANKYFLCYTKIPVDTGDTVTIEQIPEYQGALVSDGVDDYGNCDNFPLLDKEKGFTIIAIRKILSDNDKRRILLSNSLNSGSSDNFGAFYFERIDTSQNQCASWGKGKAVSNLNKELSLSYMTSYDYNGFPLIKGNASAQPYLRLFSWYSVTSTISAALYALKILNKDCTTEEIKFIAKQMVQKHKEKTGETIELNF